MKIHVGELRRQAPNGEEGLTLMFSTAVASVAQRWKNKNISVDFLADYFSNFFPGDPGSSTVGTSANEAKSVIAFVSNELLENAFKYNFDRSTPVSISLRLYSDHVLFEQTNSIDPAATEELRTYFSEIVEGDPMELYFNQLERNAESANGSASRMGFLTMRNDYGATLGWEIETGLRRGGESSAMLTTLVQVTMTRPLEPTVPG